MQDWQRAMAMLERLAGARTISPAESERLVSDIMRACGHIVTDQGFVGSGEGADCFVDAVLDGRRQRLAFEVKWTDRQADVESVEQARRMRELGRFDRTMVISRAGFSQRAHELAKSLALGEVDLLTPADLKNWLLKHRKTGSLDRDCVSIVRGAMRDLARRLAERPEELPTIEWRDLERILRETFEVLGFNVVLTRSSKDGGFDLELTSTAAGAKNVYLVEVKHWSKQKPGSSHLKKLIEVTASRKATGGLLLSTSGFAGTIYSGIAEVSAPVRLAGAEKVIALCRVFHRLGTGYWDHGRDLQGELYSGTSALTEKP